MKIKIAERIRPFSHIPGDSVLIPKSLFCARIYPSLIVLYSMDKPERRLEVDFSLKGPLKEFTILSDLERGEVVVWGKSDLGIIRYRISCDPYSNRIEFFLEKCPEGKISILIGDRPYILESKNKLTLIEGEGTGFKEYIPQAFERLSLGNHRSQQWSMVKSRMRMEEILPVFYRLVQWLPELKSHSHFDGPWKPLTELSEKVQKKCHDEIIPHLNQLFRGFFSGILVPSLFDESHQGLADSKMSFSPDWTPFSFITEAFLSIRQLFFIQTEDQFHILPHLPPTFHCGRIIGLRTSNGIMNLEWTKKCIRRVEYLSLESHQSTWNFQTKKTCRLRIQGESQNQKIISGQEILFKKNQQYFFDNFL